MRRYLRPDLSPPRSRSSCPDQAVSHPASVRGRQLASTAVPSPDVPVALRPHLDTPVELGRLAQSLGGSVRGGEAAIAVTGATVASTAVVPGDLFVAVPGRSAHGARFVVQAAAAGASAVLTDDEGAALIDRLGTALPAIVVADPRAAAGPAAALIYGNPSASLRVLGVTGTSGKTTTTFLLRAGLAAAGRSTGLIGTVATCFGEQQITTGFTTPEAPQLQGLLALMRERAITDVAMEVSSQGLVLQRVAATTFAAAAFTNLSQDHLDFHGTLDAYFDAKAMLFLGGAGTTVRGASVVVVDDRAGRRLAGMLGSRATTVSTTDAPADWRATDIKVVADGTARFQLHSPVGPVLPGASAIPGRFNVANVVLAVALLHAVGVDPVVSLPAVARATVPGRMERVSVPGGSAPLVVVDYSHKPEAVRSALLALRPLTAGRLCIVLGAGGDRDRGKRELMGQVAAREADLVIITDDNPRSEDPAQIRAALLSGARAVPRGERGQLLECGPRAQAIELAIQRSEPTDTVLIAGKGHEGGQEVGDQVLPFDDRDAARSALASRLARRDQ